MKKEENEKSPAQILQDRKRWRKYSIIYIGALGIGFVIMGHYGWRMDMVPMQYIGYFLMLLGAAGIWNINIWKGGPLDIQNDPTPDDIEDWVDVEED